MNSIIAIVALAVIAIATTLAACGVRSSESPTTNQADAEVASVPDSTDGVDHRPEAAEDADTSRTAADGQSITVYRNVLAGQYVAARIHRDGSASLVEWGRTQQLTQVRVGVLQAEDVDAIFDSAATDQLAGMDSFYDVPSDDGILREDAYITAIATNEDATYTVTSHEAARPDALRQLTDQVLSLTGELPEVEAPGHYLLIGDHDVLTFKNTRIADNLEPIEDPLLSDIDIDPDNPNQNYLPLNIDEISGASGVADLLAGNLSASFLSGEERKVILLLTPG